MEPVVRYNGKWFKITPKPFEPERMTEEIAWMKVKDPSKTYADWFKQESNLSKLLYNERPS
jgi:hypothetical protein